MEQPNTYQQKLLDLARTWMPLSEAVVQAFLETPRHLFVKRYQARGTKTWNNVDEHHLDEHLKVLYTDDALFLFEDAEGNVLSTISQPSLVLHMLEMLQVEPGHKIFELGAGSGWNAALLGHLVGPSGAVRSVEIIPEMAQHAQKTIAALAISNVSIVEGDGAEGNVDGAPYDRIIFTAGTYDVPRALYRQLKEGGLMLCVIKNQGGGDILFILRKKGDHLESMRSMLCGFVQMTGKHRIGSLNPIVLDSLSAWRDLKEHEMLRVPYWWGGKGQPDFGWRTLGFQSFLSITEPNFCVFKLPPGEDTLPGQGFFGLLDPKGKSLVLAKDDQLIAYGSKTAYTRLMRHLRQWVTLGMPTAASFNLKIYPVDTRVVDSPKQWIVKRPESQFVWSLEAAEND